MLDDVAKPRERSPFPFHRKVVFGLCIFPVAQLYAFLSLL